MSYQIWTRDDYGRFEIQSTLSTKGLPENEWKTAEEALAAAKRFVNDKNFSGPLTFDEQLRSARYALPLTDIGIYAGNFVMARHLYLKDGVETPLPPNTLLRFYIGQNEKDEEVYLTNPRRQPVTSLTDDVLSDKFVTFVRLVPKPTPYIG